MPGDSVYEVQRDYAIDNRTPLLETGWPKMAFVEEKFSGDPTNWWGPNEAAVHGMLKTVGFTRVETVTPTRSAPYRAARAVYHALKGKNQIGPAFRQDRAVFHAFKK